MLCVPEGHTWRASRKAVELTMMHHCVPLCVCVCVCEANAMV
jgi:hypothetical protein